MAFDDSKLNKHDAVYHKLLYDIFTNPELNFRDAERTVIDTIGVFGPQYEYDIRDGSIPLSNTKVIPYKKQLFPEVVGFMRNETNLRWYLEQEMNIWTANAFDFYRRKLDPNHSWNKVKKDSPEFHEAKEEYKKLVLSGEEPEAGDLGMFYPAQWRAFKGVVEKELGPEVELVDQLGNMIDKLRDDPTGRYAIVTAWNPFDVENKTAALAPCHCLFQAYRFTDLEGEDRLSLKMYQRSADSLLGVPFNNAQYATVTSTIAHLLGIKPGKFIHTFGDLHLYVGNGERANWYRERQNLSWLQRSLQEKDPAQVYEELSDRLPSEGDYEGYDHVPYAIKQLARESTAEPAKLIVHARSLDDIVVDDLEVVGYTKPDKLLVNDVPARMAA